VTNRKAAKKQASAAPRYLEIARDIEQAILSGRWAPGHRVPTETELTKRYSCARMTVSKALSSLAHAGLIERRRRLGTFVAVPRRQAAVLEVRDLKDEIVARGKHLSVSIVVADPGARACARSREARIDQRCPHFTSEGAAYCE
jgi:GntR family histidine utilization transcriptional repressor